MSEETGDQVRTKGEREMEERRVKCNHFESSYRGRERSEGKREAKKERVCLTDKGLTGSQNEWVFDHQWRSSPWIVVHASKQSKIKTSWEVAWNFKCLILIVVVL